jgi:hypothetical protein
MNEYIAPDGLMRLDLKDRRDPFIEGYPATVNNDNGILFRAVFEIHNLDRPPTDEQRKEIYETIARLQIPGHPGLFSRRAGDPRLEAHDNYVGIVTLSYFFKLNFAFDIIFLGMKTGYCYNNVEPGKFKIEAQRQGSEIALYHLCARHVPDIANSLWMAGSIINSCIKRDCGGLQMSSLEVKVIKAESQNLPLIQKTILTIAAKIFDMTVRKMGGIGMIFKGYYHSTPDHPIRRIYGL